MSTNFYQRDRVEKITRRTISVSDGGGFKYDRERLFRYVPSEVYCHILKIIVALAPSEDIRAIILLFVSSRPRSSRSQSKLDLHALHDAEPRRACRLASSRTRRTAHVRALAPALPVVVAPLRAQFRVSHLRQLLVEVAVAVSGYDALEELGRRYAWGAPRGDEFTWGDEVSDGCGWSPRRGDAGKKYIRVGEEIGTVSLRAGGL